jgi:hypothetical protein
MRAGIGVGMPFSNPKARYFFTDNFNRADANTLGSPWVPFGGSVWGISGNTATVIATGNVRDAVLIQTFVSDISIEATILNNTNNRIMFRATDNLNGYYFGAATSAYGLYKISGGGALTPIVSNNTIPVSGDKLKVIAKGSSIKCYLNGSLLFDVTESTFINGTKHGLGGYTITGLKFDDFKIEAV